MHDPHHPADEPALPAVEPAPPVPVTGFVPETPVPVRSVPAPAAGAGTVGLAPVASWSYAGMVSDVVGPPATSARRGLRAIFRRGRPAEQAEPTPAADTAAPARSIPAIAPPRAFTPLGAAAPTVDGLPATAAVPADASGLVATPTDAMPLPQRMSRAQLAASLLQELPGMDTTGRTAAPDRDTVAG